MRVFIRKTIAYLLGWMARLEVRGAENIPAQGACILAINHLSILDPAIVFSLLMRRDATALVADKHRRNPFLRWIVDQVGGIWIDRERADFSALKQALGYLRRGGMLGIAPEGTRSRVNHLIQAKPGVAFLAADGQTAILPIAIAGSEKIMRSLLRLRRARVTVIIGQPFYLPPLDRRDRDGWLARGTDEIMCRIAALLPAEYRGVYAGHPRLAELLAGEGQPVA
jgi:1-acyl-sn-glycerol-3-phosphate acyltransferase